MCLDASLVYGFSVHNTLLQKLHNCGGYTRGIPVTLNLLYNPRLYFEISYNPGVIHQILRQFLISWTWRVKRSTVAIPTQSCGFVMWILELRNTVCKPKTDSTKIIPIHTKWKTLIVATGWSGRNRYINIPKIYWKLYVPEIWLPNRDRKEQ